MKENPNKLHNDLYCGYIRLFKVVKIRHKTAIARKDPPREFHRFFSLTDFIVLASKTPEAILMIDISETRVLNI